MRERGTTMKKISDTLAAAPACPARADQQPQSLITWTAFFKRFSIYLLRETTKHNNFLN